MSAESTVDFGPCLCCTEWRITVKEFTETAVPIIEPGQLMTPDKRRLVAESCPGKDSEKIS